MNRQDAELIITEYLKPVFGFTLKRCRNLQDAEDLSQEIVLKAFSTLLRRDDIEDVNKFIWTVAHNALSNYYRDTARHTVGVPLDEVAETLCDPPSETDDGADTRESILRMQHEIAYLTRIQRRIVIAYYFENRRQADIARELGIPLGTVKWHLFEAKKELKRGMDTMRKHGELKFNPIKFHSVGICGSVGTEDPNSFFRSALSQNICYSVRNEAKTVAEIADDLGVSPVYIEGEVEFLEEYGFLRAQKDRYLINFIISEPTAALLTLQNDMYHRAAELFAHELYDELTTCGILDDPRIVSGHANHNFLLWTLIPLIAARSGEHLMEEKVTFAEAATIRPDGGHYILHAAVLPEHLELPEDYVHMNHWCGPMWNGNRDHILWQIDSEWSDRDPEHRGMQFHDEVLRILSLYGRDARGEALSVDEYAWLAERGYIKTADDGTGRVRPIWQIVLLTDPDIKARLLAIGDRIKEKYQEEFERLKAPYITAVLDSVPPHLKKVKQYELQFLFHSDGWFLYHSIHTLTQSGKLTPPTPDERKALMTVIFPT